VTMEIKRSSSKLWDWKGEEGAGISPRKSTLDVEEGEGDREKGREERMVRQGKVSNRLEKVGAWEKKMEKILDRILKGRETFPPIWKKKYVKGKKEKEK